MRPLPYRSVGKRELEDRFGLHSDPRAPDKHLPRTTRDPEEVPQDFRRLLLGAFRRQEIHAKKCCHSYGGHCISVAVRINGCLEILVLGGAYPPHSGTAPTPGISRVAPNNSLSTPPPGVLPARRESRYDQTRSWSRRLAPRVRISRSNSDPDPSHPLARLGRCARSAQVRSAVR